MQTFLIDLFFENRGCHAVEIYSLISPHTFLWQ